MDEHLTLVRMVAEGLRAALRYQNGQQLSERQQWEVVNGADCAGYISDFFTIEQRQFIKMKAFSVAADRSRAGLPAFATSDLPIS